MYKNAKKIYTRVYWSKLSYKNFKKLSLFFKFESSESKPDITVNITLKTRCFYTFLLLHVTLIFSSRSFAKPPKPVQTICECILVMKAYKEISWKTAKAMMSEGNFLKSLMEMDVDAIGGNQVGGD